MPKLEAGSTKFYICSLDSLQVMFPCDEHESCFAGSGSPTFKTSHTGFQFPTCQMRVVRLYVSCLAPPPPPPRPPPPPPPDLNRKCRMPDLAVFRAGPQLPAPAGSVPRWISTAISAWQCSPSDLNHELRQAVFPAGPQPRASAGSVPCRTSTANFGWQCSPPDLNRESEDMPDRTPECQKDCQKIFRRYAT